MIEDSYIGTSPTGRRERDAPDLGNGSGVEMTSGANFNEIDNCVISDNTQDGVLITGSSTHQNKVYGSIIGLDATGESALGNGWAGISIVNDAYFNTVGGNDADTRNIISTNLQQGILLSGVDNNLIKGNYIGITKSGSSATVFGN